ncbi:LOW QUALITY PROTEIN: uncharacterized protein LOC110029619 [Phalaenopsis equestris]|uniref:LOW QUALITY PROTEIN: uncharacterized protein LOC110029619 n=1 Tax=Phalaenopsis equestris TaxID=78828 RepID=UPI0009E5936F|nr:LOW QUALITY PROTEIN: uncharacterized protein LOC110029619 [Phalaenopsis equestris]
MASCWVGAIMVLLGFAAAAVASAGGELWKGEDLKSVHVAGKVLCQDCSQGWNYWAHAAQPVKGGKVAVTCTDARRRVVYYGSDETDDKGNFDLPVGPATGDAAKRIRPEGCSVRLLSSPDSACNVLTADFAGGRSGMRLVRPSHVYPGRIKYTVGPFFFTSPMCEEPDTHE